MLRGPSGNHFDPTNRAAAACISATICVPTINIMCMLEDYALFTGGLLIELRNSAAHLPGTN
eukprot:1567075-Pyramimonas_sp.AAC.1